MRKLQSVISTRDLRFNEVGKISLTILLIIITILIYSRVDAKKNTSSIFVRNNFLEELKKSENNQASLDKSQEKTTTFKINISNQENELKRVLYKIDSFYVAKQDKKNSHELTDEQVSKIKQDLKENNVTVQDEQLRKDVAKELTGTKMESMIDHIAAQDRETAALLVGIARIESGYSHNYSYNFWGYAGGYYGFSGPKQAVETVGKRIDQLRDQGLNTPAKIVTTWKCGRSCASHAPGSVQRWVSTVSGPYYRIAMK